MSVFRDRRALASRSLMAGAFPCSHGFTVYVVSGWFLAVLSFVIKVLDAHGIQVSDGKREMEPIVHLDDASDALVPFFSQHASEGRVMVAR